MSNIEYITHFSLETRNLNIIQSRITMETDGVDDTQTGGADSEPTTATLGTSGEGRRHSGVPDHTDVTPHTLAPEAYHNALSAEPGLYTLGMGPTRSVPAQPADCMQVLRCPVLPETEAGPLCPDGTQRCASKLRAVGRCAAQLHNACASGTTPPRF